MNTEQAKLLKAGDIVVMRIGREGLEVDDLEMFMTNLADLKHSGQGGVIVSVMESDGTIYADVLFQDFWVARVVHHEYLEEIELADPKPMHEETLDGLMVLGAELTGAFRVRPSGVYCEEPYYVDWEVEVTVEGAKRWVNAAVVERQLISRVRNVF